VLILVFGNPVFEKDSTALKLLPELKEKFPDIEFKEFDAVEDLEEVGENLIILDSVLGIKSPRIFDGVDSFVDSPTYSVHDFDLPIYIKLLKKLGKVKEVTIIGVPAKACSVTSVQCPVNRKQVTEHGKPRTGNQQPDTGNGEPGTGNRQLGTPNTKRETDHGKLLSELMVLIREVEKREQSKEENK
jgi:Ni,Fe-hydrogenase maturation factor